MSFIQHISSQPDLPRPSFISKLPFELLAEVFLLSAGPSTPITSKHGHALNHRLCTSFSPNTSPTNLSHICRLWRKVSTALPCLWSKLLLYGARQYHPELIRLWLQRSAQSPLTIEVETWRYCQQRYDAASRYIGNPWALSENSLEGPCCCGFPCPMHDPLRMPAIMSALVDHAHRWFDVSFHFSMHEPTALLSLEEGSLTGLSAVSFQHNDLFTWTLDPDELDCITSHEKKFWSALNRTHPLTRLAHAGPIPISFPNVQWGNITSLHLATPTDLSFLQVCTSLRTLYLTGRISSPIPPAVLHSLTELSTSCSLQPATTPALETLHFFVYDDIHKQLGALRAWLNASKMLKLRTLHLRLSPWSVECAKDEYIAEGLLELFQVPSLVTLQNLLITGYTASGQFLKSLSEQPFQNMRTLGLECLMNVDDEQHLINLVEAYKNLAALEIAVTMDSSQMKQYLEAPRKEMPLLTSSISSSSCTLQITVQ